MRPPKCLPPHLPESMKAAAGGWRRMLVAANSRHLLPITRSLAVAAAFSTLTKTKVAVAKVQTSPYAARSAAHTKRPNVLTKRLSVPMKLRNAAMSNRVALLSLPGATRPHRVAMAAVVAAEAVEVAAAGAAETKRTFLRT